MRILVPLLISNLLLIQTVDSAFAQKGTTESKAKPSTTRTPNVPKGVQAHESAANKAYGDGHFQIAIREYTAVLKQQPQQVDILLARADSYYKSLEIDLSRADCERAIQLQPKSALAHLARARCSRLYCRNLQHDKAAEEYSKLLILSPEDDELVSQRGNEYMHLKRYKEALKEYTRAISLDPELPTYYRERSEAYAKSGAP